MASRGKRDSPSSVGAASEQHGGMDNSSAFDFRRMLAIADALPVLIAYLDTNQSARAL